MAGLPKKELSEHDICTMFITPALVQAGWDVQTQIREEVNLTRGKVIASGRIHRRGEAKRADYLLHNKSNLPLEALLRWCDTLEAQLHQTRTPGAHLLASTTSSPPRNLWPTKPKTSRYR